MKVKSMVTAEDVIQDPYIHSYFGKIYTNNKLMKDTVKRKKSGETV